MKTMNITIGNIYITFHTDGYSYQVEIVPGDELASVICLDGTDRSVGQFLAPTQMVFDTPDTLVDRLTRLLEATGEMDND